MSKRQEERRHKRMIKETAEVFGVTEEGVQAYFDALVKAGSEAFKKDLDGELKPYFSMGLLGGSQIDKRSKLK